MGKHTALYVRASGRAQDTASQEPDRRRWSGGQQGPITWYRDRFTGKSMDRPGWNKLMKAVQDGTASALVVWRLDRLGRTAKGLTALFDDRAGRKVNLVSLKDGLDLAMPAGRLMANVLASVAQYETEVRAERIVAGQAVARARGSSSAAPRGPASGSRSPRGKRTRSAGSRPRGRRSPPSPAPSACPGRRSPPSWRAEPPCPAARGPPPRADGGRTAEGLPLRQIADRLNTEGHTTRRGAAWGATQIKRVPERVGR